MKIAINILYDTYWVITDEAFVMIGTVVDENIILYLLVGKAKENRKNFLCVHNHYNDDHFFKYIFCSKTELMEMKLKAI